MAKVKREKITVSASYYNFDERYEQAMAHLDDESIRVINVHPISLVEEDGFIQEKYIVFYQEIEVEEEEDEDVNLPRHGIYRGLRKTMIELDDLEKLNPNTPIQTVLINRDILFKEMKLTPTLILEDYRYWRTLEEKECGTITFVVTDETL